MLHRPSSASRGSRCTPRPAARPVELATGIARGRRVGGRPVGPRAVLAADVPDTVRVELRGSGDEAAGRRWSAGSPGDPVRATVAFRPLTRADFAGRGRLAGPAVRRPLVAGRGHATSPAPSGTTARRSTATDPTRLWVLEVNGRSVGMLQDYRVGDHPEYALLTAKPDAVGFDYLIGDPSLGGPGDRHPDAVGLPARRGPSALPGGARAVRRPRPPQRRVAAGARQARLHPRACGSTSRSPDGRVDTVVGCTLDVPGVLGDPSTGCYRR